MRRLTNGAVQANSTENISGAALRVAVESSGAESGGDGSGRDGCGEGE
jgi:hypothetical protein